MQSKSESQNGSTRRRSAAAEAAANLVVGPDGPGYGDRDGNGTVAGESTTGLLPGLNGTLVGIAKPLAGITCVVRDVLGSTAEDPATGWSEMAAAISAWRPDNNTMPTLASHPMRVVGWATFTLQSDSLDEAHEYAGHAQLHVDVTVRALGNLIPDPRPSDHTCERTGGELNIDTNVTGHTN